ncbi:hypothetical protein [Pelagicoccus sp. SDUM812002]|uniref:hypothetical protein n=1 Tax=Pelagicoccus sp. SDUM812002 TaxID=3041266 RepID=UPI00280F5BDB|nr:hypothetical protein [Pelagicoccus sp. SDUM812002]MDQ8187709.1 hypothetical protein [Pelagicoccus sp. SDUM812002]
MSISNTNDQSNKLPVLKLFLNTGTLRDLPQHSQPSGLDLIQQYKLIQTAGFVGLQDGEAEPCRQLGLDRAGSGRVNHSSEIEPLVEKHVKEGLLATTLHVGWGTENDQEIDQLISQIIEISSSYRYPLYVETHRATVTQDNWRTVQIAKRFPEIRFNGDFSHWYTGHEMVYGDWEEKLEFIKPVLSRVRFIHGRIATPGAIQAPLQANPNTEYVSHFRQIWRHCFEGFLETATSGDFIIFAPELLPAAIYYAQTHQDKTKQIRESSDRWQDALQLKQIAVEEFKNAKN